MNSKWNLRKYVVGDETCILELRKEVFEGVELEKLDIAFWNWEYRDNYAGHAHIYLSETNTHQLLIGHYGALPSSFSVFGSDMRGSIGCDSMTRPKCRYPWMFFSLMDFAFKDLKNHGIDFHYGFPYRHGIPEITKAAGMKHLFDTPILVKPVNFKNLCNHYLKNKPMSAIVAPFAKVGYEAITFIKKQKRQKNIDVSQIRSFGDEFDVLWQNNEKHFNIVQKRNKCFLNWRFVSNPCRKYSIFRAEISGVLAGYAVTCISELFGLRCLIVCDVLVDNFDKNVLKSLCQTIEQEADSSKVDLIGFMINGGNQYYDFFLSEGYLENKFKFNFMFLSFTDKINYQELSSKDFYLTWADSDTM